MTVADRRAAVRQAMESAGLSERRACRMVGVGRSSQRYRHRRGDDAELRLALRKVAEERHRWGYRRLHLELAKTRVVNRKKVYRLYRAEGLLIRRCRRKRLQVQRVPMPVASRPNQGWSMDFMNDSLTSGRRFRILNIMDDCSREGLAAEVDYSLPAARVIRALEELEIERGLPDYLRMDNGPEFRSVVFQAWAKSRGIRLDFIEPGKPVQNAWIESYNGRMRDECLNEHWFYSLEEARREIGTYRIDYNEVRPHSSLDGLTPSEFAARFQEVAECLHVG